MRLFVAAPISDATCGELRRLRERLTASLSRARVPPRITWVREEVAHVTLCFIGEVTEAVAARIGEALGAPLDLRPFDLEWSSLGTFPSGRSPRVIWLGATKGAAELSAVASLVNSRLDPIVGKREERVFKAHLTIGRIRDPGRGVDWRQILAACAVQATTSRVDHVMLYQSHLSPKGPTYTALVCTPLIQ